MKRNCCPPPPPNTKEAAAVPPPVTFCTLNDQVSYQNGNMVKVPRTPGIQDGVYAMATITVAGGCISAIESGTNVVYAACDPCDGGVVPPPNPPDIEIDGSGCNLLSIANGLLATLVTQNSSCIAFQGCGSPSSPLQAVPVISTDPDNALQCRANGLYAAGGGGGGGGVNYNGCGIQINNGLITAIPGTFNPVLELYNDDGTMTITPDAGNPCRVRLRSLGGGGELGGINIPLGIGANIATSGDLPSEPNNFWLAAVGNANPRNLWGYVIGIGWRQLLDGSNQPLRVNI